MYIGHAMRASVSGMCSNLMSVRIDVPQGSVLGSPLFLLFVNHSPTYVVSKCKFFKDDLKMYLELQHSNIVDMSSDLFSCLTH